MKNFVALRGSIFLLVLGILLSSFTVQAKEVEMVSISKSKATLRSVMDEIEQKTSYTFLYNEKLVDADKIVSVNVKEKPLDQALNNIFNGTNINYTIVDSQIILSPTNEINRQQQASTITVTGTVTDGTTGEEMIGVSVVEKGTSNGVFTDIDGKYSLTVNPNATLIYSFVGFKTIEEQVKGRTTINIGMDESVTMLTEVVAIGYGNQRKQDLSMSISTVKLDESMKSRPSNIMTMIQGRMPGVTIQSSGGDPLAEATISIRGRGSRGRDGEPKSGDGVLFIVDGVPNAPYNVEDVESVTVLKDAASASIYGASVGSGGVILITTKQADAGKTRVNVNMSFSMSKVRNLPKVLSAEDYNKVWAKASEAAGTSLPTVNDPSQFAFGNVTRTDWLDEIFRTGNLQHYAMSITGGSESLKAFASVTYDKSNGTLMNTYSEKAGGKLNLDFKINNWVNLRQNITFQYTDGQGDVNPSHEGPIIAAMLYPRSAYVYEHDQSGNMLYNDNGTPVYSGTIPVWAQGTVSGFGNLQNPVAQLKRLNKKDPKVNMLSTTTLEAKPITGLTIKSDYSAGLISRRFKEFRPKFPEYGLVNSDNMRTIRNEWDMNWLWESTATYATTLWDKHSFSLMGGYSMQYKKEEANQTWVYGFTSEDDHSATFPNGSNPSKEKPTEDILETSMYSMFGRLGYSFDDRYFFTGSLRRDASSLLAKGHRSETFPAVSASWKISSEDFFEDFRPYVNLLKLRGSWGRIGNVESINPYEWIPNVKNDEYYAIFGQNLDQALIGMYQGAQGNSRLTWETSEQSSVGLDISLFNSLDLSIDYFNKKTKDMIEQTRIPFVMYEDPTPGNIGKSENKGWEFSATYSKKVGEFSFSLFGNLSTVKSKVTSLGGMTSMSHDDNVNSFRPLQSGIGQPWYAFYLRKTDGIFRTQEEIDKYLWKDPETGQKKPIQPNAKPGDLKFVDVNNDGEITDDDRTYMGSYLPKTTYAFGGQFEYKGFDFSIMFQGIGGNKIYNGLRQMAIRGNQGNNMIRDVLNSYEFNPNSNIPRLAMINDPNGNYSSANDFFLESGSYLRLKNLTIGYTLPATTMKKIGMPGSRIRFYASGENLFTITPYSGIDPEVGYFGIDRSTYPLASTFSLGLNLNF